MMLRVARSRPYRSHTIKYRMSDGSVSDGGSLSTPGGVAFSVGDLINLPEGRPPYCGYYARATEGHIWQVVSVEEPNVLVVEYVRKARGRGR
jgi:hypothetical protein